MKKATWFAACLLVMCSSLAFADRATYFGTVEPPKTKETKPSVIVPPRAAGGAGETFATAIPIAALPFADAGLTCGYADDYYPVCAFAGNSMAPDLVYSYTPATDTCVDVVMCGSGYDTAIHVYDSAATLVACNDDFCGLQSVVEAVALTAGVTYYFVVDGWADYCGDYVINITECPPPCDSSCPAGGIAEAEPVCGDGYEDVTNGGCNSVPPVFTSLDCNDEGITVCGEYGNYVFDGLSYRDTDWYQVVLTDPTVLEACVCGAAGTQLAIVDGTNGCDAFSIACGSVFAAPNEGVCCSVGLNPGTYWIFVATDGFSGVPCGTDYRLTVTGFNCPPVSATPADWSKVKGLYR